MVGIRLLAQLKITTKEQQTRFFNKDDICKELCSPLLEEVIWKEGGYGLITADELTDKGRYGAALGQLKGQKKTSFRIKFYIEINPSRNYLVIFSIAKRCSYNHTTQRSQSHPIPTQPTYSSKARKTHDVIYFWQRWKNVRMMRTRPCYFLPMLC